MDLKDIQNLIKFVAKSGASEVKLEMQDVKITVKTSSEKTETTIVQQMPTGAILPQQMVVPNPSEPINTNNQPPSESTKKEDNLEKYEEITSPMIGTFYRKSSPKKPAFVEVGDEIAKGNVVCIVEAMKLFNEIQSEISGKIVKILVKDGTPVEFGTPLFLVDPS